MMKRILIAFSMLLGFTVAAPQVSVVPAAAYAVEINTDTGCDNAGAWMLGTGWTVTGSKCVGTSVSAMKMLMQMTSKEKAGHHYRLQFTISNYTAGEVRAFVGVTMPSAPAGSYITAASVADIADNFTTANALQTGLTPSADTWNTSHPSGALGAFRFVCTHANFGYVDPLVYPGLASPHLHEFYGNTNVGKSWGFNDFRTKGSSTCGDQAYPKAPGNRSGYWIPAMLKSTSQGLFAIKPSMIQIYYKGPADTTHDPGCAAASPTNNCPNIPTGLRMTFGYKASTGTGGPMDFSGTAPDGSHMNFECWQSWDGAVGPGAATGTYSNIPAMIAAGCPVGAQMHMTVAFPPCWDGVYVDSPNHRDHMTWAYVGTPPGIEASGCPADHPAHIPEIVIQVFYPIDADFVAGKWRLSSDEMATACPGGPVLAGCTLHGDYWEAWSPAIRPVWFHRCIFNGYSCSSGDIGDGTGLKDGGGLNYDNTPITGNSEAKPIPNRYVPLNRFGMSKSFSANGTYSVDLTSPADGVWGFMGLQGFSGQLDNISITEIPGARGSVTVHN